MGRTCKSRSMTWLLPIWENHTTPSPPSPERKRHVVGFSLAHRGGVGASPSVSPDPVQLGIFKAIISYSHSHRDGWAQSEALTHIIAEAYLYSFSFGNDMSKRFALRPTVTMRMRCWLLKSGLTLHIIASYQRNLTWQPTMEKRKAGLSRIFLRLALSRFLRRAVACARTPLHRTRVYCTVTP